MEIQIGEYVRTNKGLIRKVKTIYSGERQYSRTTETRINATIKLENIVKHSFNIIDLIEVGDYVNGEYICDITECLNENGKREKAVVINEMGYNEYAESLFNKDIKSIVTKEQFKQVEYKVED